MPAIRTSLVACLALAAATTPSLAAKPLALNPAQEAAMGVVLATAKPASSAPLAAAPATVTPPLNGRRVVSSPFAGTVSQVHVLEGQTVKGGAPLVTLFSRDVLTISSELAQSQAELRVADAAARRTQILASEGVIAGARAEEAQARAAQARALVNERRRLLSGGGGSGEYVLRAPVAGRVAVLHAQPGGGLEAMAPAVTLDRADKLWIEARISPAIARKLQVGYGVRVGATSGRVVALGASIDPKTRSLPLRAELDGVADLAPGQAVSVILLARAPAGAQSIPRSALLQAPDGAKVFVKTGSGYQAHPVAVVGVAGAEAVVTGLPTGARVAAAGAAQLKSALGR